MTYINTLFSAFVILNVCALCLWAIKKKNRKLTYHNRCVCNWLWICHVLLGFWWLPGENLGNRWWSPFGNAPWPFSGDLWHDCQLWEHSHCFSKLWQDHQSVVSADLCTHQCSAGPRCLHHIYSGENVTNGMLKGSFLNKSIDWQVSFRLRIGNSSLTPSVPVVLSCC